jgi:hypothetical protein
MSVRAKYRLRIIVRLLPLVVLVTGVASSAPRKPGPSSQRPQAGPASAPSVPALPDLVLTEVRLTQIKPAGTMPNGQPAWIFNLQAVFHNAGKVGSGPFKVVWERADAEAGPYVIACPACTENIANAAPGVGMLPPPRQFNNSGGAKWYRVRLDPDNVVHETNENNNSQVIHF